MNISLKFIVCLAWMLNISGLELYCGNLNGSGLCFTPNKGQITYMDNVHGTSGQVVGRGKPCPDVLYKGEDGASVVFLRTNGISYVYSDERNAVQDLREKLGPESASMSQRSKTDLAH